MMAFSFGFSGDDIEEDPNEVQEQAQQHMSGEQSDALPPLIPAKTHDLDELVGWSFYFLYSFSVFCFVVCL